MNYIELFVGAGDACPEPVEAARKPLGRGHGPLLRVPDQKFFGQVSTTFSKFKQFCVAIFALVCRDVIDTTVEFTQRAVAVCA
jgi:hypothetical protein